MITTHVGYCNAVELLEVENTELEAEEGRACSSLKRAKRRRKRIRLLERQIHGLQNDIAEWERFTAMKAERDATEQALTHAVKVIQAYQDRIKNEIVHSDGVTLKDEGFCQEPGFTDALKVIEQIRQARVTTGKFERTTSP